jgi:hypothetical protein
MRGIPEEPASGPTLLKEPQSTGNSKKTIPDLFYFTVSTKRLVSIDPGAIGPASA